MGIAISPDGNRIYATETGAEGMVYMFDRDGNTIKVFYAPFLQSGERSPVYIDVAPDGYVYVTDRLQHSIFIFSSEGEYLDALVGPDLTMSEYISIHSGEKLLPGNQVFYSRFQDFVIYTQNDGVEIKLPLPNILGWAPLGVHFTSDGTLLFTDVTGEKHSVSEMVLPVGWIPGNSRESFTPSIRSFGESGHNNDQFMFPNKAVLDSQGRIYVTDGNNHRVSIWDKEGNYLNTIGLGSGEAALGLPRGAVVDKQDRLFVVDAVNQNIKVFDVSGEEPVFRYVFGVSGMENGQFNYPNDIAVDKTGRLYITDRENNRIQVWSY